MIMLINIHLVLLYFHIYINSDLFFFVYQNRAEFTPGLARLRQLAFFSGLMLAQSRLLWMCWAGLIVHGPYLSGLQLWMSTPIGFFFFFLFSLFFFCGRQKQVLHFAFHISCIDFYLQLQVLSLVFRGINSHQFVRSFKFDFL